MKSQKLSLFVNVMILLAMLLAACAPAATPAPAAPAAPAATVAPAATDAPKPTDVPATAVPQPTVAPTTAAAAPSQPATLASVVKFPDKIAGGKPVEITTVLKPPESQPEALAAWYSSVARFEKKYPNVKITGTDYTYAPDSFAALVAGKQVPTLFEVYLTDPTKMIDQGIAADLTSYYNASNLQSVFNPKILAITTKDNKVYGIPRFAYAMGLAYNKKMLSDAGFANPPATWDELATMSQKLTDRNNGVAGFTFVTDGANAGGWMFTTIAYDFGTKQSDIVAQNGKKYSAGFANDTTVAALNYVKDLRWKYDVLPRENLDWGKNGEALATGRAAMAVMAGDQFNWIRTTYPDVDIKQFGFAPLPAGPNGSVSLVGGNIAMVSATATPDQIEAAVYWRLYTQFDPDEIVANYEAAKMDPNILVGAPVLPMYVGDYQTSSYNLSLKYANLPMENYTPFVDAVTSGKVSLVPEPLVAGQEYYAAMGGVVSSILSDKNADATAVVKKALATYQTNVLDQLK